jgi:hypothetical protein
MKAVSHVAWLLVGLLFIFSGLIKINDPVGTAIKLEEYFEVFAVSFTSAFLYLKPLALYLSIFLSALEVVLGVALLLRWRLNLVLGTLLGLMVFFTFLTFYSAYYNKVTDCGCFGDVIKLTPWQSFTKDVVLLVLIGVIYLGRRYLPPLTPYRVGAAVVAATSLVFVGIGIYAYLHEPYLDFRAYKEGADIPALMKNSAPLRYKYVMEKNGERQEFEAYPMNDPELTFKEMIALNPEDGPKITDFNVWDDEGDHTQEVLQGNKLLVIVHNVQKTNVASLKRINELLQEVEARDAQSVTPMVLTSSSGPEFDVFRHEVGLAAPYYFVDGTVLKTMMRGNPGIMLLQDGVVKGKWHHNDVPSVERIQQLL